jgi:hypothetical protein
MRHWLIAISMSAVVAGCSTSREDYAPLVEIVANAEEVTLHEGLPHPYAEKELLEEELAKKATFRIGEFDFYKEPMPLTKEEAAAFTEVFDGIDAFSEQPAGQTKCGPYHADYCLEFARGQEIVQIEICFGCNESKTHYGRRQLYLRLSGDAKSELKRLLQDRWQNRPKSEMTKILR